MKIGIVSPHSPSDDAIGEYCAHLAKELCKKTEAIVLANMNLNLPRSATVSVEGGSYRIVRIWKSGLLYPFIIFREILQQKLNVVHVQHEYFLFGKGFMAIHFPILLVLVRIARIPLIVTMHHVIPIEKARHFKKFFSKKIPEVLIKAFLIVFNRSFSISSKILVPSACFKQTLSNDYKIEKRKIEIFPHSVDSCRKTGEEEKEYAKRQLHLENKRIIMFFGYIRPSKGIEHAILAFPNLIEAFPNVIFSIVGRAQPNYYAYLNYLKQLVEKNNLSQYVRFENYVPEEILDIYFTAADVVVFPYTETVGATPIAHLRAASHGKPIVATDIDFFKKEFANGENAILVPTKNPNELEKAITQILSDHNLSYKLTKNMVDYCSLRSQEEASSRTIELYQQLTKSRETQVNDPKYN